MADKLKSQKGSPKHKQRTGGRRTGSSDDDTGYLWGKAGQRRAQQLENKRNSGYRMWENQK